MEGVAEEEEVDDQLLWNLQILSEVCIYRFRKSALFAVTLSVYAVVRAWIAKHEHVTICLLIKLC